MAYHIPHFKKYTARFHLPKDLRKFEPMEVITKSMKILDISGNITLGFLSENEDGSRMLNVFLTKDISDQLNQHGQNSDIPNTLRFGTEIIKYRLKTLILPESHTRKVQSENHKE